MKNKSQFQSIMSKLRLDLPSLLTVFLNLNENEIFHFIFINKKCFDVSQSCLINPCKLNKKVLKLLQNLQTLNVGVGTLERIGQISENEKEIFKSQPFVWRISINSNDDDHKRDIWDIVDFKKIRKLVVASSRIPEVISENIGDMDELVELRILAEFVPILYKQIQQLTIKKLVIYLYQKCEVNYQLLLNHPICKNIILYSIFEKDVVQIKQYYPSIVVVFQPNYLPISFELSQFLIERKIYLSFGFVRIDSSELETSRIRDIQKLYLPGLNISDCQPLTIIPPTHHLEIDTYFPDVVSEMDSLRKFVFFEKLGYFPNHYDFSKLTQLTSLTLYGNYQRKRKIFLPSSIKVLESSCFLDTTKNIVVNKKKGLQQMILDRLFLKECVVSKIGLVKDELVLIDCSTEKVINAISVKKLRLSNCPVKTVIVSPNCLQMNIECASLKSIETKLN